MDEKDSLIRYEFCHYVFMTDLRRNFIGEKIQIN